MKFDKFDLVAHLPTGEKRWHVPEGTCRIGRSHDNDVILDNSTVSAYHALLIHMGHHLEVEDLESKNHTYIQKDLVTARRPLRLGEELTLGAVRLQLDYQRDGVFEGTPSARVMTLQEMRSLTPPPHKLSRLLELLVDMGSFLLRRNTRQEIYESVLIRMADLVDYQLGCLFLWNGWELQPVCRKLRGNPGDHQMAFSRTVLEGAARNRTPLYYSTPLTESMHRKRIGSALAVPLLDDDHVIGILYLHTVLLHPPLVADDVNLVSMLAVPLALKISSCDVADELERARCVQQALLSHLPSVPAGYELHTRLEACAAVAGDLYDLIALPDGRYAILLGDVVGHGVSAALQMAALLATVRATAGESPSPRELIQNLRERACGCLREDGFVTLFVAYLNPGSGRLEYASAGQDGVGVLYPDGHWETLPTTSTPIGMPILGESTPSAIDLPPGAMLAAWSDGFTEAHVVRGQKPNLFGSEPVLEILGTRPGAPLDSIATALFDRVRDFEAGAQAADDRTLLLLRRQAT